MYTHTATIIGNGAFPLDMLRYDSCYPRNSEDATEIHESLNPESGNRRHIIKITKRGFNKTDTFTAGRWQSFGWYVDSIESRKV